ncbi:interacting zinc finger 1a [Octopus vulgaris]|nr:interacting zinc finger 1a [Octopus vulgaris]
MGGGMGGGMNMSPNMNNNMGMGNYGGGMMSPNSNMGMGNMMGSGGGMMMQQQQNMGVQQQAMRETQLALVNTLLKGSMIGSGGRSRNLPDGGMGLGMLGSSGPLPSLLDIKTSGIKRRSGSDGMSNIVKRMKKDSDRSSRGKDRIIRPNDRRRPQGSTPSTKKRDQLYSQGRKDQSSNRRQRDTSAKKKMEDDDEEEDEMYDPAEPTDDEIQSTEHSNGGLTVTVDGSRRSVTEDTAKDSGSDGEKADSSDKKSQYFCHACIVECYNNKNFKNHMRGTKHRSRMDDLANLHQQKSSQLFVRLKAEEHLRNIEKRGGDLLKKHYCSVCELNLSIPYNKHRQTKEHQQRVLEVYGNNKVSSGLQRKGHKMEEYSEVPEYEENKTYGQNYIIAVSGYFCKLCHKFYNNENAAKNTHCQSKSHFEKFEKIIREKIEAKKKAEAAEAEMEKDEDNPNNENGEERENVDDEHIEDDDEEEEEDTCKDDEDEEIKDERLEADMKSDEENQDYEGELEKTLIDESKDEDTIVDEDNNIEDLEEELEEEVNEEVEHEECEEVEERKEEEETAVLDEQIERVEEADERPAIEEEMERKNEVFPIEGEEEVPVVSTKTRSRSRSRGRGRGKGKK